MAEQQPVQSFVVRIEAGQRVYAEGDLGATLYILQSGRVQLVSGDGNDRRVHGILEKGEFFGESSVLEGLPRSCSAEVLEDAELIEINSVTFEHMLRGNLEIAVRMLRKLSLRLREAERRVGELEAAAPALSPAPAPRLAAAAHPAASTTGLRLEVEGDSTVFPLFAGETLIGRFDPVSDLKPDIDLTAIDLKRTVSRRHARVVKTETGFAILEESGAMNGTFVNGERIAGDAPRSLADGDRVRLGSVKLVFRTG